MKTLHYVTYLMKSVLVLLMFVSFTACEEGTEIIDDDGPIVGQPGNPRFNLQFTNEDEVDLDLYVQDPNGNTIYYANPFSYSGGELDIDCACYSCPNGPNENIFWPDNGSAPIGTYRFWVEYFGSCNYTGASSSYTLRVMQNGTVVDTKTGVLSYGSSSTFTYQHRGSR